MVYQVLTQYPSLALLLYKEELSRYTKEVLNLESGLWLFQVLRKIG